MTSNAYLEIKGNLREHPFAELLTEIAETRLTGSFRLASGAEKVVVYVREGRVIFAVANARHFRLFENLLRQNTVTKDQLTRIPNFTSDIELAEALKSKGLMTEGEIEAFFVEQISQILRLVFSWREGEWLFSPLARVKESIAFDIDATALLLEYGRTLAPEVIVRRYKSFQESFGRKPNLPADINLTQEEAFVLSRFETAFLKVQDVKNVSALSDSQTLQVLYTLWVAGFLYRQNWQPAFSEQKISAIQAARLSLKKEASPVAEISAPIAEPETESKTATASRFYQLDQRQQLEIYLKRVEDAESFYEILDVTKKASNEEIKNAYFALAKRFHPDKFHKETNQALQQRIQNAFTEIAKAYDTLKDESSRELYDFRLRKHLAGEPSGAAGEDSKDVLKDIEEGRKAFEQGYAHLKREEIEMALPFFARAVQLVPDNARYHAFYGKLLAADETQRHKAEAMLQTAVTLDAKNSSFRLMLCEFYIQYNLNARARGELQRLLAQFPNNREAREMLDSLANG